jgi:hypothetical protein
MQKKILKKVSRFTYDLYLNFMPTATIVHEFNVKVNSKYRFHIVEVLVQCVQKNNQVTF